MTSKNSKSKPFSINYKKLEFYNIAYELTLEMYKVTKYFPKSETYGLISQLNRASSSMHANIAEGSGRTRKDFVNFLRMSIASGKEVETFLKQAKDVGHIEPGTYDRLNGMVNKFLGMAITYKNRMYDQFNKE